MAVFLVISLVISLAISLVFHFGSLRMCDCLPMRGGEAALVLRLVCLDTSPQIQSAETVGQPGLSRI